MSDELEDEITGDDEPESGNESVVPVWKLFPLPRLIGLVAGPVVFLLMMLGTGIDGLSPQGQAAAAITLLMAIWWVTEAIPIYATALVPVVLFPLTGVLSVGETTRNYGHG